MLLTKLHIPSPPRNLVHRSKLFDKLNKGLNNKLILISAPAGFGKTMLISDWIDQNKIPAAWYSLDNSDNATEDFLSYIILGIQKINTNFGAGALKLIQSSNSPNPESIASMLLNDILNINQDFLLVLDDFHVIVKREILEIVDYLLEHLPQNVHIVISTRSDPSFALARLRSQHQLLELRSSELSFSVNDISILFNKKLKLGLSIKDIESIESKTEGWIAGLQLAALSIQGYKDASVFIKNFTGNNRYIMDYLIEEVLKTQSDDVKDFLLKTSILEQISAPLCDAVLDKDNSQSIIEELEKNNIFIFPLDEIRHWYRYHHLFADLLKQRLLMVDNSPITEIHNKACNWFEQNEMFEYAIEHALKMCHKLFDVEFDESQNMGATTILTRISYRQFIFQQKNFNNFARNYYIYNILWSRVPRARSIDVISEIENEIGIPYNWAILFAYALAGNKYGHFWIYDEKAITEINDKTELSLTVESHTKFVKWCSGTFDEILNHKSVLPPFVRYPLVETKSKPVKNEGEVFMIISQQFLHDKLTSGLYFNLIDRFRKGDKKNKFKELFGYVFQEYVGELLRFYFHNWEVIPEIKYKKGKRNLQDSIDWFVKKDEKLIMIEVKQSSIFLKSKQNPSMDVIISDLRKTIIKAVTQLSITESDIKEKKYPELSIFNNIKSFVKLIVINDPLFNANFLVKTILKNQVKDLTFQIININDFETILSSQSLAESLFDVLFFKALEHNEMDFNEYIYNIFPDARSDIEFLKEIWDSFFKDVKIE